MPRPFDQDDKPSQPVDFAAAVDHFADDAALKEDTARVLAEGDQALEAERQARSAELSPAARKQSPRLGRKALTGVAVLGAAAAINPFGARDAAIDVGAQVAGSSPVEESAELSQQIDQRSNELRQDIKSGKIRLPQQPDAAPDTTPEETYQQARQADEVVAVDEQMRQGQDLSVEQVADQTAQQQ